MKTESINYKQAFEIVSKWVEAATDGAAEICNVEDKSYGWVFYYQSKNYDQNDISTYLAGNAPIIFDRVSSEIRITGTAFNIDHYLKVYEATLPQTRLIMSPEPSGFKGKCK